MVRSNCTTSFSVNHSAHDFQHEIYLWVQLSTCSFTLRVKVIILYDNICTTKNSNPHPCLQETEQLFLLVELPLMLALPECCIACHLGLLNVKECTIFYYQCIEKNISSLRPYVGGSTKDRNVLSTNYNDNDLNLLFWITFDLVTIITCTNMFKAAHQV